MVKSVDDNIISLFLFDTDCITHNEDKNAFNLKYIVCCKNGARLFPVHLWHNNILFCFCCFCYLFCTKLLLDAGVDINTKDGQITGKIMYEIKIFRSVKELFLSDLVVCSNRTLWIMLKYSVIANLAKCTTCYDWRKQSNFH